MKKILVVEDVELHQDLMIQLLETDFDVITAFDGAEGVKFAKLEHPDLIFMDLSLPVMDGWEAARQIRASPETSRIPIIALLTRATRADLENARAAGCDDYLTKPITENMLGEMLSKHLR